MNGLNFQTWTMRFTAGLNQRADERTLDPPELSRAVNVQFDEMTEFIKRHDVKLDSIVSHYFPLEDGPEAYRVAAEASSGKVCFTFR